MRISGMDNGIEYTFHLFKTSKPIFGHFGPPERYWSVQPPHIRRHYCRQSPMSSWRMSLSTTTKGAADLDFALYTNPTYGHVSFCSFSLYLNRKLDFFRRQMVNTHLRLLLSAEVHRAYRLCVCVWVVFHTFDFLNLSQNKYPVPRDAGTISRVSPTPMQIRIRKPSGGREIALLITTADDPSAPRPSWGSPERSRERSDNKRVNGWSHKALSLSFSLSLSLPLSLSPQKQEY